MKHRTVSYVLFCTQAARLVEGASAYDSLKRDSQVSSRKQAVGLHAILKALLAEGAPGPMI